MDALIARRARLTAGVVLAVVMTGSTQAQSPPPQPAPTAAVTPATTTPPTPADAAIADMPAAPVDLAPAEPPPPKPRPVVPVGPPKPVRSPAAVLRVLDKVSAETLAFEAPVGRRVRYKSLVFEVKACETRDVDSAQPQPSAYLTITSDAGLAAGSTLGVRQVFKGWMFANAPSLHALKHPVYDAWLVACSAAPPPQ